MMNLILDIVVTGGLVLGTALSVAFVVGSVALLAFDLDGTDPAPRVGPEAASSGADVISFPQGHRTSHLPARWRRTGRSAA